MAPTPVTCPTCGTISYFEDVERDAGAFCRVCDYPLFWVRSVHTAARSNGSGDAGLRRLPGAGGRATIATFACPVCTEPNPISATICIRCGSDLHPAPPVTVAVPVAPPPPPPVVEPPPVKKKAAIWPWVVLGLLGVLALALILIFTL